MAKKQNEFLKKLQATFKIEAEEHLKRMSSGLLELEKKPTVNKKTEIIETIFREAHSLKGAARAVDMRDIEAICQSLESLFSTLKRKKTRPSPKMLDTLHHAIDFVGDFLLSVEEGQDSVDVAGVIQQLTCLKVPTSAEQIQGGQDRLQESEVAHPPEQEKVLVGSKTERPAVPERHLDRLTHRDDPYEQPKLSETVRIATEKLDALFLEAEAMLSVKQALGQRAADLRNMNATVGRWKKEWAKVYPEIGKLRQLQARNDKKNGSSQTQLKSEKLLEFLDWNHTYITSLGSSLTALENSLGDDRRSFGGLVNDFLEDAKKILILPFSSLLEMYPKLVRDLARDQSKEVELVLQGREVEIDRRILEEIKDPLIHLLRNCIDHGIEKPEERRRRGKPPRGTVTVAVSQINGNKVEVLISDDGAGINVAKVKEMAVKTGIVTQGEADKLNQQQALSIIFQSEFSMSPIVTDISGRGLGLAITQEKLEKLGGLISVKTEPRIGTSFRILLPLTLAIFRGFLVRAADRLFIVPLANVDRVVRVKLNEIKTVENKETISLAGGAVSLVRLDDVLKSPRKERPGESSDFIPVLVLRAGKTSIAFMIDEVLNEQEVLVKSLGRQLSRVRNIAGAAVLGSGQVVPIVNVPDLIKSAVKITVPSAIAASTLEEVEVERKSILIVEDSITSRTLLMNILDTAGYHVQTAIDGVDAFTTLQTDDFDLVVSDVEMPRMNGFELTSKIRSDRRFSELPVVLVTALESREDRERGIDVGANAYIVKSSFDQSNLLEVLGRLL